MALLASEKINLRLALGVRRPEFNLLDTKLSLLDSDDEAKLKELITDWLGESSNSTVIETGGVIIDPEETRKLLLPQIADMVDWDVTTATVYMGRTNIGCGSRYQESLTTDPEWNSYG
jgi:hypothetical protein